jgi:DNA-binding NarL/FixJ family response regulator
MEELTSRKSAVLDVLDEQIAMLEKKLEKAKPLFDELNQLKQTRRVLLSERMTTGGGGATGPRLSMEEVIRVMDNEEGMSVSAISEAVGFSENTVRSHLNRHKDVRYEQNGDGLWSLIGESTDEESDEED